MTWRTVPSFSKRNCRATTQQYTNHAVDPKATRVRGDLVPAGGTLIGVVLWIG
jgi:hypothetical protein